MSGGDDSSGSRPRRGFAALARLALWLGLTGFGGGYAVLAQVRISVIERLGWLTELEYVDLVSVAQSLPGAVGANFFTQLGLRLAGVGGAALATALFLAPSAALMIGFGAAYDHLRSVSHVQTAFAGMNPAIVGIIASVAWTLARRSRRPWQLVVAAAAAAGIELEIVDVLEVVLFAVLAAMLAVHMRRRRAPGPPPLALLPLFGHGLAMGLLPALALVFLRIGVVAFGGGLAMIPILDHELVARLHWLGPREFSDAVTLGQVTPGPIAITATFVGYRVAGTAGALLATAAVFAPPFVASVVAGRSLSSFRSSPFVAAIFSTLGPTVVGVVAAACLSLSRATIHGAEDAVVAVASALAVLLLEAPPWAVLLVAIAERLISTHLGR